MIKNPSQISETTLLIMASDQLQESTNYKEVGDMRFREANNGDINLYRCLYLYHIHTHGLLAGDD